MKKTQWDDNEEALNAERELDNAVHRMLRACIDLVCSIAKASPSGWVTRDDVMAVLECYEVPANHLWLIALEDDRLVSDESGDWVVYKEDS